MGTMITPALGVFFLKIKTLICKALGKTQKHINKCDDIDNDDGDVLYNHSHALS